MSDYYRTVTAVYRGRTSVAFYVDKPTQHGAVVSIPRSLLHSAFTFRLREWKAEELGFA